MGGVASRNRGGVGRVGRRRVSGSISFTNSDRQLASVLRRRFGSPDDPELVSRIVMTLARAVREDHVALDLEAIVAAGRDADVSLGSLETITDALRATPALCAFLGLNDDIVATGPPLVMIDGRFLYFRRLATTERRVALALRRAANSTLELPSGLTRAGLDAALRAVHDDLAATGRQSPELGGVVTKMLTRQISFITGGPGTGKTWIITQALRVLDLALANEASGVPVSFAVAAPTGKAARRVAESIDAAMGGEPFRALSRDLEREGSLHHLLGLRPDRLDAARSLTQDLVIVDEASMADLNLIDLLLRSANDVERPSRVVFIGDPSQLASVNVGAVLADAVDPTAGIEDLVTRLRVAHRFGTERLTSFAAAIESGEADHVLDLLAAGEGGLRQMGDPDDPNVVERVLEHARALASLAATGDGDAALGTLRELTVLCANREGRGSVAWWNDRVRDTIAEISAPVRGERFAVGEPVLVTRNQRSLGLSNGDVGVVVESAGERVVVFDASRRFALGAIGNAETAWAMTIHKSQGSEYRHVVVVLPRLKSPLLSRELLYTGVTRARDSVTVVGELDTVREAVRHKVDRVSGLTYRLAATR